MMIGLDIAVATSLLTVGDLAQPEAVMAILSIAVLGVVGSKFQAALFLLAALERILG
jgi:hypothetical protein